MTKKDFIALAAALKHTKPSPYVGEYRMWRDCVIAVLEVCAKDNAKFDRWKFINACGVPNLFMPGST